MGWLELFHWLKVVSLGAICLFFRWEKKGEHWQPVWRKKQNSENGLKATSSRANVVVASGGPAACSLDCCQCEHGRGLPVGWLWNLRKDALVSRRPIREHWMKVTIAGAYPRRNSNHNGIETCSACSNRWSNAGQATASWFIEIKLLQKLKCTARFRVSLSEEWVAGEKE